MTCSDWDLHPHMHIWVIIFTFLYKRHSLNINAPQLKYMSDSRPTAIYNKTTAALHGHYIMISNTWWKTPKLVLLFAFHCIMKILSAWISANIACVFKLPYTDTSLKWDSQNVRVRTKDSLEGSMLWFPYCAEAGCCGLFQNIVFSFYLCVLFFQMATMLLNIIVKLSGLNCLLNGSVMYLFWPGGTMKKLLRH